MMRRVAMIVVVAVVIVGCSTNIIESDEYQELAAELEATDANVSDLEGDRDALTQEVADLSGTVDELTSSLDEVESKLSQTEQEVAQEASRADAAEAALTNELDRPWPDFVVDQFVEGCTLEPDPTLTAAQQQQLCSCMVDEIAESTSLVDFMMFSLALVDSNVDLDPVTGFPTDVAPGFVEEMLAASFSCFLRIEA
jgi:outer membrane murein-binding lipoprotein Lpp